MTADYYVVGSDTVFTVENTCSENDCYIWVYLRRFIRDDAGQYVLEGARIFSAQLQPRPQYLPAAARSSKQ